MLLLLQRGLLKNKLTLSSSEVLQFILILGPESEPEVPKLVAVVEEEMESNILRPQPQLVLDAFYESLHPGCRIGKLRVSFDSYSSIRSDSSIDDLSLKLLKKHYESNIESERPAVEDQLDWQILSDLLVSLTVTEDCTLGLSLMLTEMRLRDIDSIRRMFEDPRMSTFLLHVASLESMTPKLKKKTFEISAGILYATAKALHEKKCLDSKVFEIAMKIAEIDWSE